MPRIMLVDDEPNILKSLRRCIATMPVDTFLDRPIIETFDKPRAALRRATECTFDLVISDWRMPDLNGVAFLSEFIRIQPNVARIILSGYGDFLSEAAAINRVKIFVFINKPWDSAELAVLLRRVLEHSQLQRAQALSTFADGTADRPSPDDGLSRIDPGVSSIHWRQNGTD
jgi:two-component system, probable response regulator PhcQ